MTNTALITEAFRQRKDARADREERVVRSVLESLGVSEYVAANGVYDQPKIRSLGSVATPEVTIARGPSWPGNNKAPKYTEVEH